MGMYTRNARLLAKGYAPAPDVCELMEKDKATIKRMVDRGALRAVMDGNVRYIDLESVEQHYRAEKNPAMATVVRAKRSQVVAEGVKARSRS